jgi:hypothetical protein
LVRKGLEIEEIDSFAGEDKSEFIMSKRKSEAAFSIDSFLNDSDVDEDDLLLMKPSGLKKVASPTSNTNTEQHSESSAAVISQEESAANSPSSDTNSPQEVLPSEEDLDQEGTEHQCWSMLHLYKFSPFDSPWFTALKEAQRVFQFQTDYHAIRSTALLKWYAVPGKGKKKGRHKYAHVFPCYICPNQEQAMAGYDDEVQLNQRNNTLIRFMGYQVSYRNQIQAVPAAHLLEFNHGTSNNPKDAEQKASNTWCPTFMKQFLNSLRTQQEFKAVGSEYKRQLKIKVEEKLLDLVLMTVFEQEQKLITGDAGVNSSVPDDPESDDEAPLEWQSPSKPAVDNKPAIVEEREKSNATSLKHAPKRLRAGDIIECW